MVLYLPGQEPQNIKERITRLFEKLDSAYPDKVVVEMFYGDHLCNIDGISEEIIDQNRGKTIYINSYRGVMSDEDVYTSKPNDYWNSRDDLMTTI